MTMIGFVGLGAMGLPMAHNLVAAGHTVRGFDRRREAVESLAGAGGVAADDAAAAAREADLLVLMVVNAAQAEGVLFQDGAIEALAPDGIVILMATCAPAAVEALAARVIATGRRFLDAPVSGGVSGATNRTLTVMASGERATFEAAKPILDVFGDKVFFVGERPGQGATVKTINQLLCGVHIAAAAEAFSLAERMGIDGAVALEILGGSAASSWMLKDRGPRMLMEDPPVKSAVDIFVKDLGIVLAAGTDARLALPLSAIAHQLFLAVSGQGKGQADDSQVIEAYRALGSAER